MRISGKQQRDLLRIVHLVIGGLVAGVLYTPLLNDSAFRLVVQIAVFPALVLTGLGMWKMALIRRIVRGRLRSEA